MPHSKRTKNVQPFKTYKKCWTIQPFNCTTIQPFTYHPKVEQLSCAAILCLCRLAIMSSLSYQCFINTIFFTALFLLMNTICCLSHDSIIKWYLPHFASESVPLLAVVVPSGQGVQDANLWCMFLQDMPHNPHWKKIPENRLKCLMGNISKPKTNYSIRNAVFKDFLWLQSEISWKLEWPTSRLPIESQTLTIGPWNDLDLRQAKPS